MNDDRLLHIVGVALVGFILLAVVTGILAATNPDLGSTGPADTEWSGEAANETHFRITYDDGPPIPASELVVSVDGYDRHDVWSGRVTPGDAGTVRVASDSVVRLYWVAERGPRDLLADWTV